MSNTVYRLYPEKLGDASSLTFVGNEGEIFYNPTVGNIRISDGATVGGKSILIDQVQADYAAKNQFYVDPARHDETYVETGSIINPFRTILAAQTSIDLQIAAGTISPAATNPIFIILSGSTSENVTLTKGHIYLVGNNGSIHSPIYLTGVGSTTNTTVSISGSAATLDANHFAITGLSIVAPPGGKAISGIGTNPQRIFLKDVWITASGTTGTGFYQDNTGTGSITHGSDIKVSHSGSGDVYCFNIVKGTATFSAVETSGATQVGAAQSGTTLSFTQSELDANGDCVVEAYGTGVISVTLSAISNTKANGHGVRLNSTYSTALIVNNVFSIDTYVGTGKAAYATTAVSSPYGLYAIGNAFAPLTNTGKSAILGITTLSSAFT